MQEAGGRTGREGYVYVLVGDHDYCKIGRTQNPKARIGQIEPKLPFEVELAVLFQTKDCVALEAELHKRFSYCRKNGEWFVLTEQEWSWLTQTPPLTSTPSVHLCACCGKVMPPHEVIFGLA